VESVITDTHLIRTFFFGPAVFLLTSVCDNTVRMDSDSMDFRSLQISFTIPTEKTTATCACDHGHHDRSWSHHV